MCPNCRAFITAKDRVCPYCDESVGPRYVERMPGASALGGLISQTHYTTFLILLINGGLFIATYLLGKNWGDNVALWAFGAKFGPSIWREHQWWRLVTAGFLHGGLMHIGMNSWVLYDLGAQVEQVYGTPRYLSVYFMATVGGFWLSAYMNPGLSIGSSAGITGLLGAMIAFGVANRTSIGKEIRNYYVRWVVYILALGLYPGFSIDNWAHLGGLAAGFGVAYLAGTPVHSTRTQDAVWKAVATGCVLATAGCFLQAYLHFPAPDQLR